MEKSIRKNTVTQNFEVISLLAKTFGNRFTLFVLGFIALIIVSHNYNQEPPIEKSLTAATPSDSKNSKSTSTDEVVEFAKTLLGEDYTPAGKNPSDGFDCSGFTQYVYKKFSIEIPPSSITQSKYGEAISMNEAEKGDLIFFKSPTFGNNNIGHVGIIVSNTDDELLFIHSSTSRGVVIDSMKSRHYKSRFRSIRRII